MTIQVDRATFEPEAVVEREGDLRQAEAVEKAFVEAVEATTDQTEPTGDKDVSEPATNNVSPAPSTATADADIGVPESGTDEDESAGGTAAPFIPGGSVVSAAILGAGQLKDRTGG